MGISGGGWRALAGHMGAFRALSNKGALPMVDMYSAVSGGSWFLSKLSFDNDFAGKVLGNHTHIAEDALQWFEGDGRRICGACAHAKWFLAREGRG